MSRLQKHEIARAIVVVSRGARGVYLALPRT